MLRTKEKARIGVRKLALKLRVWSHSPLRRDFENTPRLPNDGFGKRMAEDGQIPRSRTHQVVKATIYPLVLLCLLVAGAKESRTEEPNLGTFCLFHSMTAKNIIYRSGSPSSGQLTIRSNSRFHGFTTQIMQASSIMENSLALYDIQ